MKRTLAGLIFLSLFAGVAAAAGAQTAPKGPNPAQAKAAAALAKNGAPTEAEIRDLIRTLEDEAERKKLIARLNAMLAVTGETKPAPAQKTVGSRVLDLVSSRLDQVSTQFVAGTRAIMDLPNVYEWAKRQASSDVERARWIEIAWKLLLAIAVGLAGEWIVRRLLARPRRTLETRETDSFSVKLVSLLARTLLDIIPIAGFLGASSAALILVQPGEQARLVVFALINANVWVRVMMAVARLVLVPAVPRLRLLSLSDIDANYLFIWTRRFAAVAIYGYFAVVAMRLVGLPPNGADVLFKALGLLVMLMFIVFTLQNRAAVATWLRGDGSPSAALRGIRTRVADLWHLLVILYIVVVYGVWMLAVRDGFEFVLRASFVTLIIVMAAWLLSGALRRLARRVFALSDEVRARHPELEARANRYLPILENALAIVIWVIALFAVLEAWGVDSSSWLATPLGHRVIGSIITIALLLIVTVAALEVASAAIERYLSRDGTTASARARTLLPLLRTTLLVVLATIFILVTLSEIGVNIAPLLAGAGVVGLAVGFGAQTLVKDIITGMFILMEDQMAVGDVVRVGSHAGLVERLTLRTIRLRDLAGTVHVVPFSEVTTLENLTKDFSRYVFDVGVAYREDTDQVVEVLRQIGEEMMQDDEFKDLILEPLEILGVDSFGDNAVIIKARIATRPIKQWMVGREFNRRMKRRFDELGIEIPFPHRTLYFGEDKTGKAPPARIAMTGDDRAAEETRDTQSRPARGVGAATPQTGDVSAPEAD